MAFMRFAPRGEAIDEASLIRLSIAGGCPSPEIARTLIQQMISQGHMKESQHLRYATDAVDRDVIGWEMSNSIKFGTAAEYEQSFREVLDGDTLRGLLEKWDPKNVAALDLMGYGEVLHELGVQHGLAVALSDARAKTRRDMHGEAPDQLPFLEK